jgi:AraC-like DNA-binding protein/quercetin dioxygenase-like cupin family protein
MRTVDKNKDFERQTSWKDFKLGSEFTIEPVFFSYAQIKAKSNYEYHRHTHPAFEIIIPENGIYHCLLNGEEITLSPGEFLIVQIGDIHQDICSMGLEYVALTFQLKNTEFHTEETRLFRKVKNLEQKGVLQKGSPAFSLYQLLKRKAEDAETHEVFNSYVLSGIFNAFFWEMISFFPETTLSSNLIKSAKDETFRVRFLKYLQNHICEKLDIEEMAVAMNMSKSSFAHRIKMILGASPAKVFLACKTEKAAELLKNSDWSIKEISSYLGFEDQFHFSKVFKRHFNMTPSSFRK